MSSPAKLFYNGFESKRKAITFAVKCLRMNKLVTQEAEIYYEDTVWDTLPDGAIDANESYDFSTPTSEDDEMYYRVTASMDDYGWSIVIEHKYIPTPDPEMAWYEDPFYGRYDH